KILPKIKKTVNEQLKAEHLNRSSDESKTSYAVAANISELELKKNLIDKMDNNKRRDDEDKDKEPSAGSNWGSKRRRAGKELESTTEEPRHTTKDLEEPTHLEFKTGVTEDQPAEEISQLPDWFQKPAKSPTPDRDWNKTFPDVHGPVQPWLSSLVQMEDPRDLFNELMDTPLDFSALVMNRLKVGTLTPESLAGPTFELMKGLCKSLVELEYFFEEVNKATTDQLEWNNPEVQQYPHDLRKPLPLIPNSRGNRLEMSTPNAESLRLRIQDIEDMLLLLVQGKLTNLTVKECLAFNNKDKKNRLMRIDELHKFSDGTLNDVRTTLDDRLKGIWMKYLPRTIWRQSDRDKAGVMIQAIDKQLKTKRIIRSLEKFVSGRPYEGDFWLLQRTI
ncbi:hypothetical protein Tco_1433364, partial [Tanacetum coccineum]